jgi:hypothetical protein
MQAVSSTHPIMAHTIDALGADDCAKITFPSDSYHETNDVEKEHLVEFLSLIESKWLKRRGLRFEDVVPSLSSFQPFDPELICQHCQANSDQVNLDRFGWIGLREIHSMLRRKLSSSTELTTIEKTFFRAMF